MPPSVIQSQLLRIHYQITSSPLSLQGFEFRNYPSLPPFLSESKEGKEGWIFLALERGRKEGAYTLIYGHGHRTLGLGLRCNEVGEWKKSARS